MSPFQSKIPVSFVHGSMTILSKSLFQFSRPLSNRTINYASFQKPFNYLNVSEFLQKYSYVRGTEDISDLITLTGRLAGIRSSGSKLHFLDLLQEGRTLQLILNQASFEASVVDIVNSITKGDIVEVCGVPGRTKSGELSCKLRHLRILTPCLENLPDAKIGLKDVEVRSQKRYLDLIANPDSFATFKLRSRIISSVRNSLESRDFMEVETPILSDLPGGAVAKPFKTTLSAADDRPLTLRIAPELFLKRLLIGGFDRVFELGKQFRDEGIDATHNPEFTSCEFYAAYMSLEEMMALVEELILHLAAIPGISAENKERYFAVSKFKRIDLVDELEKICQVRLNPRDSNSLYDEGFLRHLLPEQRSLHPAKLFDKLVGKLIEPQCQEPTFLLGHPLFCSPLAREDASKPGQAGRFELFVGGREIANGYLELNDPEEQKARFLAQSSLSDSEIPPADESFVEALRAGMPPACGCGIGIDRLVMILTGKKQIRDVLLFPLQ